MQKNCEKREIVSNIFPQIFHKLCGRGFLCFEVLFYCKNNYFKIKKDLKTHLAVRFSDLMILQVLSTTLWQIKKFNNSMPNFSANLAFTCFVYDGDQNAN